MDGRLGSKFRPLALDSRPRLVIMMVRGSRDPPAGRSYKKGIPMDENGDNEEQVTPEELERLRDIVEQQLMSWCEQPLRRGKRTVDESATAVKLKKAMDLRWSDNNSVRFQQCGGGRRVIRRGRSV